MMDMNVPDFLDNFIMSESFVEVRILVGDSQFIYIGSPANYDAFSTHMSGMRNTNVCSVKAENGKVIISAVPTV